MYTKEKSTARRIVEGIAGALAVVVAVDLFGFMAWIASGQTPADGFYIGRITAEVLRAILF
ncbi:MAG: hypothetical protein NUV80_04585 [Candidatus Berkelbacteria bacterium]|nr:hypothetical protein [Candidatus Berkelbacteria bacterium]